MLMKTLRAILGMSPPAWEAVMRSLQFSCAALFGAFTLLVDAGTYSIANRADYALAGALAELPLSVLLLASIASVVIEEQCRLRRR